jgi:hypothetical protein
MCKLQGSTPAEKRGKRAEREKPEREQLVRSQS